MGDCKSCDYGCEKVLSVNGLDNGSGLTECQAESAIRLLKEELDASHTLLTQVENRLDPILSPEQPDCEEKNSCPDPSSGRSRLINQIDEIGRASCRERV